MRAVFGFVDGGVGSGSVRVIGGGPAVAGPEAAEKAAPSGTENVGLAVGDTATTTEDGNTLTLFSYESSLFPAGASEPKPGFEFSAIEVEGCASPSSGRDLMQVGSTAFVLLMPDGARVMPAPDAVETGVKEPVLETMDPYPASATTAPSGSRRPGVRGRSPWSSRSSLRPRQRL